MGSSEKSNEVKIKIRWVNGIFFREYFGCIWFLLFIIGTGFSFLFLAAISRVGLWTPPPELTSDFHGWIILFIVISSFLWVWTPKWVATISPSGFQCRSHLAASFFISSWKKVSWNQIKTVRSVGTREKKGVIYNWATLMEYPDSKDYYQTEQLKILATESHYSEYLEGLARWVDHSRIDPDLLRILDPANRKAFENQNKFMRLWEIGIGLCLAGVYFSIRFFLPMKNMEWLADGFFLVLLFIAIIVFKKSKKI